jgi:hypothetical protein
MNTTCSVEVSSLLFTDIQQENIYNNYCNYYNYCTYAYNYATHDECGSTLCNAVGCRKRFSLRFAHKAHWCPQHLKLIKEIRSRISHNNSSSDFQARAEELALRKDRDIGHMAFCYKVGLVAAFTEAQTQQVQQAQQF